MSRIVPKFLNLNDAITMSEIATPSSPASGKDKLYFKSDGNLYSKNSAGLEKFVGGPGISGTNWQNDLTFTVSSGFGTVSGLDVWYRRVGDSMQVRGTFTMGTVATALAYIQLPSGYVIDSAKLGTFTTKLGDSHLFQSTNQAVYSNGYGVVSFYDGSDTAKIYFAYSSSSGGYDKFNVNAAYLSGDSFNFDFTVPISGWSVNNGALNGVIAANGNDQTPTGTLTNSLNVIKFTTTNDTNSAYNNGTGLFTCPADGWYQCQSTISVSGTAVSVNNVGAAIAIYQNGSNISGATVPTFASGTNYTVTISYSTYCAAGDTLGFYARCDLTSPSYSTFISNSNFSIVRLNS